MMPFNVAALAIGSDPAPTGEIRLPNGGTLYAANHDGDAPVQMLSVTDGDDLVVGGYGGDSDTFVFAGGAGDVVLWPLGAGIVSTASGLRVGAVEGGSLEEALHVAGNGYFVGEAGAWVRFADVSGKNWRLGSLGGRFELQCSSDEEEACATVTPAGVLRVIATTKPPAGGAAGLLLGSTGVGVYVGTGPPTAPAADGSLYLRADGPPSHRLNGAWATLGG